MKRKLARLSSGLLAIRIITELSRNHQRVVSSTRTCRSSFSSNKLCTWRHNMPPAPLLPKWAPKCLTPPSRPKHSSMFPRWPLQLPDALTWRWVKRPGDLWPFDPESGVRVTCDVGYLYANFGLLRPFCCRLRPNICDRHQTKASLNAPAH